MWVTAFPVVKTVNFPFSSSVSDLPTPGLVSPSKSPPHFLQTPTVTERGWSASTTLYVRTLSHPDPETEKGVTRVVPTDDVDSSL